jgi:hypothetical protein
MALFIFANISAPAQNNRGQAVLHIQVNIVSVVKAPPVELNKRTDTTITYSVPVVQNNVEVIEEIRPLNATHDGVANGSGAVLKTLTIVPR